MSKNTRTSSKQKGIEKKVNSKASKTEIERNDQYEPVGEETGNIEERNSSEWTINSVENVYSFDNDVHLRKRGSPESREKLNNKESQTNLFPTRRRSCHDLQDGEVLFCRSTKRAVSTGEVGIAPVATKEEKETFIKTKSHSYSTVKWIVLLLLLVTIVIYAAQCRNVGNLEPEILTIESIKQKFPKQKDMLWKAISSGLNDTLKFEHPSSYILLHESDADNTVKELLQQISQYAVCQLSSCSNIPIKLNKNVLNSTVFVKNSDYGMIVARFKKDLENIGVMVIENLDEIPEKYALAFHSFCDQVSPLVKKSAFFFTMKIDNLGGSPMSDIRKVEKILKEKWKHIEDDVLSPLLTRIIEMPIRINQEQKYS